MWVGLSWDLGRDQFGMLSFVLKSGLGWLGYKATLARDEAGILLTGGRTPSAGSSLHNLEESYPEGTESVHTQQGDHRESAEPLLPTR